MVNIIVSTKVNNKWVMLIILIIFDVNKSHVTILSDLCIVRRAPFTRASVYSTSGISTDDSQEIISILRNILKTHSTHLDIK